MSSANDPALKDGQVLGVSVGFDNVWANLRNRSRYVCPTRDLGLDIVACHLVEPIDRVDQSEQGAMKSTFTRPPANLNAGSFRVDRLVNSVSRHAV